MCQPLCLCFFARSARNKTASGVLRMFNIQYSMFNNQCINLSASVSLRALREIRQQVGC